MIYIILVFGLIIRLISINQSLWLDEATSALVTRMPWIQIFSKFLPGDFHPPFYYLLLKAWSSLFGTGEITLRVPSVIFGVVTIYLVYLITKDLFNKKAAFISSLLLATSGLHVYYSQEARMYSLAAFLTALSVFSFVKTLKRGTRGDWVLFTLSIVFLFLTDYLAVLILPAYWIYVAKNKKQKSYLKRFVTSHIILVLVVLSWLPTFAKQLSLGFSVSTTSPSWWNILGLTNLKNILLIPIKFMIGRVSFYNKSIYGLVVGGSALIFGYPLLKSLSNKKPKLIWLWLAVPTIFAIILGIKISILSYFRLLFVLPAFYVLVAYGITYLKKPWISIFVCLVIALNILTTSYYLFNTRFHREDWRLAAEIIDNQTIVFPSDFQKEALTYYKKADNIVNINNFTAGAQAVWLSRYVWQVADADNLAVSKLKSLGYNKVSEADFNGVVFWKYEYENSN
ncbi:glycosyltransferase family 39 protein [Patescibacteria group bacterium]